MIILETYCDCTINGKCYMCYWQFYNLHLYDNLETQNSVDYIERQSQKSIIHIDKLNSHTKYQIDRCLNRLVCFNPNTKIPKFKIQNAKS